MTAPEPAQQHPAAQQKSGRSLTFAQIVGVILLLLVVVFIVENTDEVSVRVIGPKVHTPLYVALLIAAVLGAVGAALLRRRRREHRK